jgi:putative ABC transport system permease protein
MIKNYFKIAWRNIAKYRFYAFVNIIGLFFGITFTLAIAVYIWGEWNVNKDLANLDQQLFLKSEWSDPNMGLEITSVAPLAKALKDNYPHLIKNYYRWDGITSGVSKKDKNFRENIQIGDSTLLSMYGFKLLYGSTKDAFTNPYSVVITNKLAIKYFGKTNVVGETITMQNFSNEEKPFLISGVLANIPINSVMQLEGNITNDIFIASNSASFFNRGLFDDWNNIYTPSYIELMPGHTSKDLTVPIQQLLKQHTSAIIASNLKVIPTPLSNYYLEKNDGLVKRMLYTLSIVALFILSMAIINFINISISHSSSRMKEIGVRKVLGGERKQLVFQFLSESILMVAFATTLAVLAYPFLKHVFGDLVGKALPALSTLPSTFAVLPICLILVVGFLSGLYPAFVLSSFKSIDALKGKSNMVKDKVVLRKSLVVFQFGVALVVLITAIIVYQQVTFFFSERLGYNKDFVITAQVPRDWSTEGVQHMSTSRNELAKLPEVSSISLSYEIPNGNNGSQTSVYLVGKDSAKAVPIQQLVVDDNYIKTFEIPIKAGTFFNAEALDSLNIILNEKAVAALGYPNSEVAIGQQIRIQSSPYIFTIKGVTKDFHFDSMQGAIAPMMFTSVYKQNIFRYLSIKLKAGNLSNSIAAVQKQWTRLLPNASFEYNFMDDTLSQLYASELRLKKAAYIASILSLLIALLGVLSLASLSIYKRLKEIGIRKVLGASLPNIVSLFLKEFIGVIFIASVLACPFAYWLMKNWLDHYAYHIQITLIPFILALAGLGMVTLVLICLQALRAALENPTKNLRSE